MPLVTFYFQLHQPLRLHPDRDKFLWDRENRDVFNKVADKCYLPALAMFGDLLRTHPPFRITLGLSGTFLEQAEQFRPEVIRLLQEWTANGSGTDQVELLDETYYHSLVSLFQDANKQEFRDQVTLHREKIRKLFGVSPTAFRNTELMYNTPIAEVVADMGYQAMLCERRDDMFLQDDRPVSPNAVFRAKGLDLVALPRNRELSDDIAFRFPRESLSPAQYASYLARIDGEAVLLGYDFEHIGEHIAADRGIFEFWRGLPEALREFPNVVVANPSEVARRFRHADCPSVDIHGLSTSSWADAGRDTFGWLGNHTQQVLFHDIEGMEADARRAGGELLARWRILTTSDHVYFLHERIGEDHAVHAYFNPYGGSIAESAMILTRKIDNLQMAIRRFEIIRQKQRTAVLIVTPETGRLSEEMGGLAKYISGKSGGQGEVVAALCEGLSERGIDVHLALLNLKRRFQCESQLSEKEWQDIRYRIDAENIHLVSSAVFADNLSAYGGNLLLTAAEFQKAIVNNTIKQIRARNEGRLIVHSHDWMAGGVITAYARRTGLPVLHTVHNVFTHQVPVELYAGINLSGLAEHLFLSEYEGRTAVDCQATALKNATIVNTVGFQFLREIVEDHFLDRSIVPPSVRNEIKVKFHFGAARAILNAPASNMYPERCPHLVRRFGPDDAVLQAKQENLLEFQKRTGLLVDPQAILFFWPSRLDVLQKGVDLLEAVAWPFVMNHGGVQMAIVADGVGSDRTHTEHLAQMALASGGRIAWHPYSEALSMLGFAAAHDVFGASLYEPCGQIDQVGNLFGATATNRDTGGYHDKIRELCLKVDGAPQDSGNGFLFRDYDPGGLWYALENSLAFHRRPWEFRERQIQRIMREARERYDLSSMIAEYVRLYEQLNNGRPLV